MSAASTLETVRQLDYERFEANRRFEELTDIAERLGYPIDVTIRYELRDDAVYALSDTVDRPFHNQTLLAKEAGKTKFTGDQAFEQIRLAHEHDEALLVDQLAAGKLAGNVLIKVSKVPDAVVRNETTISGYRRDLLRTFIRMYRQTEQGVDCRLFTLDHNHELGMKRVGELLGIDTSRQSEAVLADQAILTVPGDTEAFVDALHDQVVDIYDRVFDSHGRRTFAGSNYVDHHDAMQAIYAQRVLVEQHMRVITGATSEADREDQRRRTAAAIKLATEGFNVMSSMDVAVSKEVASGNYDRDCPTALASGMNQAAKSLENVWSRGECRVCFASTMVGSCYVCATCAAADDHGVDLLKLRDKNLRQKRLSESIARRSMKAVKYETSNASKRDVVSERYGSHATTVKRNVIGGAKRDVIIAGKIVATI